MNSVGVTSKLSDGVQSRLSKWAVVQNQGTLFANQSAASSTRTALGRYQIVFNNVTLLGTVNGQANSVLCSLQATIAFENNLPPNPLQNGQISAFAASNNTVEVRTYSANGAAQDRDFHLTVLC